MTTKPFTNLCSESWVPSFEGVSDLTFDSSISLSESKYIVKAVGEILLDIQKFISSESLRNSENASPKIRKHSSNNVELKRANFRHSKNLSDDEINPWLANINEPTGRTYHRRILDSVVSTNKKPVDCQNGSLNWKEIESNKFSVPPESRFECPQISNDDHENDVNLNDSSQRGNVYSVNRFKVNINAFVTSFYKHYPIISYSSFILSLIYIDRFIKSQWDGDLTKLGNFNITR